MVTLVIDKVSKRFGEHRVLDEISFEVNPGELYGFCGANGAGKTTAMRVIMGILRADSGEVRWNDRPVNADTRRSFGYMPEERGLYPKMRPIDQLVYLAELSGIPARTARGKAEQWCARLDVSMRPKDTLEKLSLGNQQKIQLIAALIHEPALLVLDEPFSGLDPMAVDALSRALAEFGKRGVPVLFSSHQLDLVERLCDRVGILREGRLIAQGTVAELRADNQRNLITIGVSDAAAGWQDSIPGARALHERDGLHTFLLTDPHRDPTEILDAARTLGRVTHFSRPIPTLAEIFTEVVAA